MLCATFGVPSRSSAYRLYPHEAFGSIFAEKQLILATLAADGLIFWEIWVSDLEYSLSPHDWAVDATYDLKWVPPGLRDRVQVRTLSSIRFGEAAPDIFVTNIPKVPAAARLRNLYGFGAMPICGLLHSACTEDMLTQYLAVLATHQSGDLLISSSKAGLQSLRSLMRTAQEAVAGTMAYRGEPVENWTRYLPFGSSPNDDVEIDKKSAKKVLHLHSDATVILSVGRLSVEYKGDIDILLGALAALVKKDANVVLVLAGQSSEPGYLRHIERRANLLGLEANLVILRNFPEFIKPSLYAAADIVVALSDSIQETFGLAVLEAMLYGKPVIASDWSGYRELIINKLTGRLIQTFWSRDSAFDASAGFILWDATDMSHYLAQRTVVDSDALVTALFELHSDGPCRERMGDEAKKRAERVYGWNSLAPEYVSLWSDQIESRRLILRDLMIGSKDVQTGDPSCDLSEAFSHFASETLRSDLRVSLSAHHTLDEGGLFAQWPTLSHERGQGIAEILELCSLGPHTVQQLISTNIPMDSIVWLAKKGLCCLQSPGERNPNPV